MKLYVVRAVVTHRLEFFNRADAVLMTAFANPDGKRSSPIPLARDTPVDYVIQEVSHSSFLDIIGNPIDGIVVPHQVVVELCHLDEPARPCVIDERGVASPAMRIAVLKFWSGVKQTCLL